MAKILIVGCGSIGGQLAFELIAKGHTVVALKRHPPPIALEDLIYFEADVTELTSLKELPVDFEVVYFIVSPDGRTADSYQAVYERGINNLLEVFSSGGSSPRWIFVSSTSVYGQTQGEWVDEQTIAQPDSITSHFIRQGEIRLIDASVHNIVVRFSGIYGPGREYLLRIAHQIPSIQQYPSYYTNRIHQQDCVGVLLFILESHLAGSVMDSYYIASDDDPAPMWEVMNWLAQQLNILGPTVKVVQQDVIQNKRCNNQRLKKLGYEFQYSDYKSGYNALLEERGYN